MLVSIIVPMYNAELFVSAALESVLREKTVPIEVIVVNDKSTDASVEKVLAFRDERVRVIDGPGRGVAMCLNAGLAQAKGSIVMRCDADDKYPTDRIARQVRWLQNHPAYDAVCGSFSTITDQGNLVANLPSGVEVADITEELMSGRIRTSLCTYAMRSTLVTKVGGFREFFETSSDLDFQLRLGELGRIAYVPEDYYYYRLHAASITHTRTTLAREFFDRTARELQIQRLKSGMDDLQRGFPPPKPSFEQSQAHSATDHVQELLIGRAWREHRIGQRMSALRTGVRALAMKPWNIRILRSLFALAFKASGNSSRTN